MRPTVREIPAEPLLDNDTIQEVLRFVSDDHRYESIGMRGAVATILRRRLGVPPSAKMVTIVADAFWDACEECLGRASG